MFGLCATVSLSECVCQSVCRYSAACVFALHAVSLLRGPHSSEAVSSSSEFVSAFASVHVRLFVSLSVCAYVCLYARGCFGYHRP